MHSAKVSVPYGISRDNLPLTNLLEENKEFNQQCKNLQEENKKLKHVLNLENQKNERFQEENISLRQYIRNLEKQKNKQLEIIQEENNNLQQYIQTLEKQKNEQLEIFSQNLEKTLEKLELNKLDKVNDNDTNYDDDSINYIEDSSAKEAPKKGSTSTPLSTKKELVSSQVKSNWNLHDGGNLSADLKPPLPKGSDYKKAITDYLREIGKLIREKVLQCWNIDFYEQALLVLTVPAEYSDKEKAIMRKCVFDAGLIKNMYSGSLQFTTEPEAAAIYCMQNLATFMIVDCGGGTIDLTIHNEKLLVGRRSN
ncbi:unnamed protein product [Rhizophagus irregularis]|nr:unnamed protein product [Rhizophagus irregularis]